MKYLFLLIIFSSLMACAAPSLKKNDVTQAEIDREAKIQKELAQQQLFELRTRLKRVEAKLAPQVRELCSYLSEGKIGGCYFPLKVQDSPEFNAFTDGKEVVFHSGIIKLLDKDEELAVVLGHEYAHAMLLHINKKKTNMFIGLMVDVLLSGATGVSTDGAFSNAGASAYSKDFELEADYAGLYLAHRAGYDISQAANVWRKMAIETGSATTKQFNTTHPSSPKRFVAQERAYAEIIQKEIDGQPMLPDKLAVVETDDSESADTPELIAEPAVAQKTATVKSPKQERVFGKYSIAAEKFAERTGCDSGDETLVVGNMVSEEFGAETYSFQCVAGEMFVECEFGNCSKL